MQIKVVGYDLDDPDDVLFAQEVAEDLQAAYFDALAKEARDLVQKTAPRASFKAACLLAAQFLLHRVEDNNAARLAWLQEHGPEPLVFGARQAAAGQWTALELDAIKRYVRERVADLDCGGKWCVELDAVGELVRLAEG
jgi:hypothetical protein